MAELPCIDHGIVGCGDCEEWRRRGEPTDLLDELDRLRAENERLRRHIEQARDLVAEAYRPDERDDSPGNMAFAVLTAALGQSERGPVDTEVADRIKRVEADRG